MLPIRVDGEGTPFPEILWRATMKTAFAYKAYKKRSTTSATIKTFIIVKSGKICNPTQTVFWHQGKVKIGICGLHGHPSNPFLLLVILIGFLLVILIGFLLVILIPLKKIFFKFTHYYLNVHKFSEY